MAGAQKKSSNRVPDPKRQHQVGRVDGSPHGRANEIIVEFTSGVQDSVCVEAIGRMRFRPLKRRGFSLWFYSYGDVTRETKIYECGEPLTWRSAARVLLSLDEYVIDPLDCEGDASGVDDFASPLLMACWSRGLSDKGLQAMFAFPDDELRLLWDDAVELCGVSCDVNEDVEGGEDCEEDDEVGRSSTVFLAVIEQFGCLMAMGGVSPRSLERLASLLSCDLAASGAIAAMMQKLERYTASNGIPILLAREAPDYLVAPETLAKLRDYPYLEDCQLAARLAYSWTVAEHKPIGKEIVHNIPTDSELTFLRWLFCSNIASTISVFRGRHPTEAVTFMQWIAWKRRSAVDFMQILRRGGRGGFGQSFGLAVKQREVEFCDHVLAAAEEAAGEAI